MIYCLTGELIYLDALSYTAVIDCAGVGYKVTVTGNTLTKISAKTNETVRVFTYMSVKEDAVDLFGFADTDEADAFKLLITVSGVGPKAALAVLSAMTPTELSAAVAAGDHKAISRAQGVGSKIAARIVLELKDKLAKAFPTPGGMVPSPSSPKAQSGATSKINDARDALMVLGFSRAEATRAIESVNTDGNVEDIIRLCLARLMK